MNVFNALTLKEIFFETTTFFKKLEYRFSVESTIKIENASFIYKTPISEANVKTKMVSTKWICHKERSFVSTYFTFLKFLFQFKYPLVKSWFDVQVTQMSMFVLFVSAGVLFGGDFSLWVLLTCFRFCQTSVKSFESIRTY